MSELFNPQFDILPVAQRLLWGELIDVPNEFTLYGGTAIALHLGHRKSVDFDFFGTEDFDPDVLLQAMPFLADATITQKSPSTLTVIVNRGEPVQVSFFGVPTLNRINAGHTVEDNGVRIASIIDLAGTKAAVVQKRAEAKDYIDIDAMIQAKVVDLPHALVAGKAIYGRQFNPELTLKALCFFGDGTLDRVSENTRQRLTDAVRAVDLRNLPTLERSNGESDRGSEL